jgi:crossover junction endodeoxyribonuclease RusA
MPLIEIRVIGTPAPQGSKRAFVNKYTGRAAMVESSSKVKPWRESVKYAAHAHGARLVGPVSVELVFTLPKPKSAPKTRRTWPDRKPDVDKLTRSTLDALVQAGTIEDDARVVRLSAAKKYPLEGDDSLDVPGAVIRVMEVRC